MNELDMSFEDLQKQYTPMLHRVINRCKYEDFDDLWQESSILLWKAHQEWRDYYVKNGGKSFKNFAFQKLLWWSKDVTKRNKIRRAVNTPLTDGHLEISDQHQTTDLLNAELDLENLMEKFSPSAQEYVRCKLEGRTVGHIPKQLRTKAIGELTAWKESL